jgi:pimeloyl-ACP methyl ester carboxylesterase
VVLDREPPSARHARDTDSHALTIDDVGDPAGTPVVYLHGGGDSRLSRHPDDTIAASLGVRLLAVDRCGPDAPGRTLLGFAGDLVEALDVPRFRVVGWSAGGPHALALAAFAPERVDGVALVGSLPPPHLVRLVHRDVRLSMFLSRRLPPVARRGLEAWGRRPVPATGSAATDEAYARGRVEGFSAGGAWLVRELAYLTRPWGFEFGAVQAPVALWWGDRDVVCPPAIGAAYAELLPHAELRIVGGTHQLLFARWREILAALTAAA